MEVKKEVVKLSDKEVNELKKIYKKLEQLEEKYVLEYK